MAEIEENNVHILEWPEQPAKLEHQFNSENPCPVSIAFQDTPARVAIQTSPEDPLNVDMAMHVSANDPLPVCIQLCEPICAQSDYQIGIVIFDRPVATITIRGLTRLFNCEKEV
jgi:hypothetical protein